MIGFYRAGRLVISAAGKCSARTDIPPPRLSNAAITEAVTVRSRKPTRLLRMPRRLDTYRRRSATTPAHRGSMTLGKEQVPDTARGRD